MRSDVAWRLATLLAFSFGCTSGGVAQGPTFDGGDTENEGPDSGPSPDAGSAPEPGVRFVGRYDDAGPSRVRLSWSGSGFVVRFNGTGARATLSGGRFFTVVVDGRVQPEPLAVSDTVQTYDLASDLLKGEHTVEVYRRTEGMFGPTVVHDVEVDGELLAVPRPGRQMEVVGDSGVTGYGVEGPGPTCGFSADTENHCVTWNAITARAIDAELSTVAWSGKGAVYNYGTDRTDPMPVLYDRVIATEPGSTGTIRPADLVLVSLGANDYSTDGDPPESEFVPPMPGCWSRSDSDIPMRPSCPSFRS